MTPQPSNTAEVEKFLQELQKQEAIEFKSGLPGFIDEKRFVLLQNPEERPFIWMHSVKTPGLCFIVSSPFVFFPEYRPDVSSEDLRGLGDPPLEQVLVLSIIKVIPGQPLEIQTNLKAPIVINLQNFQASQVIVDNESMYSERAIYKVKNS